MNFLKKNDIEFVTRILYVVFCILFINSCTKNPLKKDVSNIDVAIKIERFDQDIKNISKGNVENNISNLKSQYSDFFTIYNTQIINIVDENNQSYLRYLNLFLNDYAVKKAYSEVDVLFNNMDNVEEELNSALKYYKYYYPNNNIPQITTFISGFNLSIVLTDNHLGIGLDKYLGADCQLYEMLGIERYLRYDMSSEYISVDVVRALAENDFPNEQENKNLLSEMLYNAKILYFINAMLPDIDDARLNKYSASQLGYCKHFEKELWINIIENKKLFTTDIFEIRKLTQNSPYTAQFGPDCPPRVVNFLGLQIIRSYMKNNKVSLQNLMEDTDYQSILQNSNY